ncbi:hypothetical protein T492DRAFT_1052561 [Pavlovales sp. CCMP2436]|nr:hypothetical protein T492DRAFT_1052561 [Pavlovales sp. CCMP2436]
MHAKVTHGRAAPRDQPTPRPKTLAPKRHRARVPRARCCSRGGFNSARTWSPRKASPGRWG